MCCCIVFFYVSRRKTLKKREDDDVEEEVIVLCYSEVRGRYEVVVCFRRKEVSQDSRLKSHK